MCKDKNVCPGSGERVSGLFAEQVLSLAQCLQLHRQEEQPFFPAFSPIEKAHEQSGESLSHGHSFLSVITKCSRKGHLAG